MARSQSKRKEPEREVKQLHQKGKLESSVFDRPSLLALSRMMKKGIFKTLDYPIATGKEADVYRATCADGSFMAVKMYRIDTSNFVKMQDYIHGDYRFEKIAGGRFETIIAWTRKEYKNLIEFSRAGARVPKPVFALRNILVMEFLGEAGVPFSTLGQTGSENPQADFDSIIDDMAKIHAAGFVHADVSEYNIIMDDRGPYLIDCGQGVPTSHPGAAAFLLRDVQNVIRYFSKHGIVADENEILGKIKKGKP